MKRDPCPHCGNNNWRDERIEKSILVNPNGEYVEGYGHMPVTKIVPVGWRYWCTACGWLEGGNPTIIRMNDST